MSSEVAASLEASARLSTASPTLSVAWESFVYFSDAACAFEAARESSKASSSDANLSAAKPIAAIPPTTAPVAARLPAPPGKAPRRTFDTPPLTPPAEVPLLENCTPSGPIVALEPFAPVRYKASGPTPRLKPPLALPPAIPANFSAINVSLRDCCTSKRVAPKATSSPAVLRVALASLPVSLSKEIRLEPADVNIGVRA